MTKSLNAPLSFDQLAKAIEARRSVYGSISGLRLDRAAPGEAWSSLPYRPVFVGDTSQAHTAGSAAARPRAHAYAAAAPAAATAAHHGRTASDQSAPSHSGRARLSHGAWAGGPHRDPTANAGLASARAESGPVVNDVGVHERQPEPSSDDGVRGLVTCGLAVRGTGPGGSLVLFHALEVKRGAVPRVCPDVVCPLRFAAKNGH